MQNNEYFNWNKMKRIWNTDSTSSKKEIEKSNQMKRDLIKELKKQHNDLHRAKLNICISLDQQKCKIREKIKQLQNELSIRK